MGLDMYLTKKTYVKYWEHKGDDNFDITVSKGGKNVDYIKPRRISEITEEVGYWRKANAIHKWFVDNCQGGVDECQETYVELGKLKELLLICTEVKNNPSKAKSLLPPTSGFFFGSTDTDEYYFDDIEYTINILESILNEEEENNNGITSYYYQSSW